MPTVDLKQRVTVPNFASVKILPKKTPWQRLHAPTVQYTRDGLCVMVVALFTPVGQLQAPVFVIEEQESSIHIHVKTSTKISGKFDTWDAS